MFKWTSLCGLVFPLLLLSLLFVGCTVNQEFVSLMETTNSDIIRDWEKSVNKLPGIQRIPEEEKASLIRDILSAAYVQKKAIVEFKKKEAE